MKRIAISLGLLAAIVGALPAAAEWKSRPGGGLGQLVSNVNAQGDELFVFCAQNGVNVGFIPRISTRPGGPTDISRLPLSVTLDATPAVMLTVEGFDGAWISIEPQAGALAARLGQATTARVVIAEGYAAAFEAAEQSFALDGLAAAIGKARFPARCRMK